MNKYLTFQLLLFLISVQLISAQNISDTLNVRLKSLEVNAQQTRLYGGFGRALTIVDRKSIEQIPAHNIDELLKSIAGIDIRQRGVGGTQSDISIRGGSFDQVMVLLNGVNITDPQTGHYNLDVPVELSDIVRVELLEGSAARIYGPNAFSGAVNIITNDGRKNSLTANLMAGSYKTAVQNIAASAGNDKIQTYASFSNKTSAGYRDNTDYHLMNLFSQTVFQTMNSGKFNLQLAGQLKDYGANGFYSLKYPSQFDHTQTYFAALDWTYNHQNTSLTAQTYFRRHYDRFELYRDSIKVKPAWYTDHNYHLTDVTGAKATAVLLKKSAKYTIGIDLRNEHIYSTVLGTNLLDPAPNVFEHLHPFTKESNRLLSTAFVDVSKTINSLFVSLGASVTHTDQYGLLTFGGFDLAYLFDENLKFCLSANTAVRLPSFTDLYYKSPTQSANPDLLPERSKTFETGLKYNPQNVKLNLSIFYRNGENVIDWVKKPENTIWESRNLTSVNAFGVNLYSELAIHQSFIKTISLSYSYLHLNKQAENFDSKYVLDYMKNKVVVGVNHKIISRLSASWQLSYNDRAGDYTDFISGQKTGYTPFVMLNGRFSWLVKHYEIYVTANNLLNVNYADYGGLIQPGINFMAGVRLKL